MGTRMARRADPPRPADDDDPRPLPPERPRRVHARPPKVEKPRPPRAQHARPAKLNIQPPPRRVARPLVGAARIQVTLGPADLAWLDAFAASHRPPITNRAEALRRVVALARAKPRR